MLGLASLPVTAQDEVDYVALGAQLLRDGHADRAAEALAKVDPAVESIDLVTYHTARGMVALEQQQPALAADAFAAAIAAGQGDPLVHLYRAQALLGMERYDEVIEALDTAGDAVLGLSGAWLMRAHAHWMDGNRQAALDTLAHAGERFPGNTSFLRRQVFYLIEAGLHQEAAALGREYLARAEPQAADYAAIGTALRQSQSYDEALRFLETARLRFPDDAAVAKALAQTWLARGDTLALNARIVDQEKKLKQRVGLLLQLRRYEQVAGMEDALYRVGLFRDEDVRYALAYSRFKGGDFEAAEGHLAALTRPELFRKATELRRLMQDCADARWSCV
jgi:tetratricopeptide (TPR) repeat protein